MAEIEESIQKAGSWIPQIFFDLIARVVPGTVMLLVITLCLLGPGEFLELLEQWKSNPPTIGAFLGFILPLMIAVSYSLAICLWGCCYCIFGVLRNYSKFQGWNPELFFCYSRDDFDWDYEIIKHYDPVAGTRLTKLKAEIHLSSVLILGLAIATIYSFRKVLAERSAASATDHPNEWLVLLFLLLIAVAGSVGSWLHFRSRTGSVAKDCIELLQKKGIGVSRPVPAEICDPERADHTRDDPLAKSEGSL